MISLFNLSIPHTCIYYKCEFYFISPWTKWSPFRRRHFSNAFYWMKILESRFNFHWNLFLRVQLTITRHWFRLSLVRRHPITRIHAYPVHRRIYAALGELIRQCVQPHRQRLPTLRLHNQSISYNWYLMSNFPIWRLLSIKTSKNVLCGEITFMIFQEKCNEHISHFQKDSYPAFGLTVK